MMNLWWADGVLVLVNSSLICKTNKEIIEKKIKMEKSLQINLKIYCACVFLLVRGMMFYTK